MVRLPPEFTATKFTGYFWNTKTGRLFTMKPSGVLRELKKYPPNRWNHWRGGYRVCDKGACRFLQMSYLNSLSLKPSVIPVKVTKRGER